MLNVEILFQIEIKNNSFFLLPFQVRLLTGIGRYTEMNYVLQILKANDQFEYLLGKGSDKVPNPCYFISY